MTASCAANFWTYKNNFVAIEAYGTSFIMLKDSVKLLCIFYFVLRYPKKISVDFQSNVGRTTYTIFLYSCWQLTNVPMPTGEPSASSGELVCMYLAGWCPTEARTSYLPQTRLQGYGCSRRLVRDPRRRLIGLMRTNQTPDLTVRIREGVGMF